MDGESINPRRPLYGFILATLAVGLVSSQFTEPNIAGWYADLTKPSFNPPNWIFAPVWTTLYIVMAVAAWRVWRVTGLKSVPMVLYGIQLALNFAWSYIFFSAHEIGLALGEILALWVMIALTAASFWRVDRVAGLLFLPYLAWVSFASLLNYTIWTLNT
jgi:tryptophan-rich sensory protein